MEYLLLIASDETAPPSYGSPEFDAWMGGWNDYHELLVKGKHLITGAYLQPTATATTIRKGGGRPQVLDGPFIETKEQIGGFYVVSATDLDEALKLADAMPLPAGSIEIRPLASRTDG